MAIDSIAFVWSHWLDLNQKLLSHINFVTHIFLSRIRVSLQLSNTPFSRFAVSQLLHVNEQRDWDGLFFYPFLLLRKCISFSFCLFKKVDCLKTLFLVQLTWDGDLAKELGLKFEQGVSIVNFCVLLVIGSCCERVGQRYVTCKTKFLSVLHWEESTDFNSLARLE